MARNDSSNDSLVDKAANAAHRTANAAKRLVGFDEHETTYRQHFTSTQGASSAGSGTASYDDARPAYQLGYGAAADSRYAGRSFDEAEADLRSDWESHGSTSQSWDSARTYARGAYDHARDQRLTLSEEQLEVGTRQVQAGEVNLRKTVETKHVQERVPLVHEEVTIERRPLSADSAANLEISEESIRVPLMAEEAVVAKRVVATEEVVVRKAKVTEDRTVEADVRKERLVTEGLDAKGTAGTTKDRTDRNA